MKRLFCLVVGLCLVPIGSGGSAAASQSASLLMEAEVLADNSAERNTYEIYWTGYMLKSVTRSLTSALHDRDRGYEVIDTYEVWLKKPEVEGFQKGLAEFRFWGERSWFGISISKSEWRSITLVFPGQTGQDRGILLHTGAVYGGGAIGYLPQRPWETFAMDIDAAVVSQILNQRVLPSIYMESFVAETPYWSFYWGDLEIDPSLFALPEDQPTPEQRERFLRVNRGNLHRGPQSEDSFVLDFFYPLRKPVEIP